VDLSQIPETSGPERNPTFAVGPSLLAPTPEPVGRIGAGGSLPQANLRPTIEPIPPLDPSAQRKNRTRLLEALARSEIRALDAVESADRKEADRRLRERLGAAFNEVRPLLVASGSARLPIVLELSNSVGFPDPGGPNQKNRPDWGREAPEKIEALRTEIKRLDRELREKLDAELAVIQTEYATSLAEIRVRRAQLEDAIYLAKENELDRLLNVDRRAENLQMEPLELLTPARWAQSQPLPALPRISTGRPKRVASPASQGSVEDELQLFLKIHGYQLAPAGPRALDRTKEFSEWRKSYQVGR